MSKLTKEKRNHLVLAVGITLALVAALYLTLIRYQLERLHNLDAKTAEKDASLKRIQDTKKNSKEIEAELEVVRAKLQLREGDMASGDHYSTMINIITTFKQPYSVEIPQFTSGGPPAAVNLLPKFPYQQYSVTIAGTAFYSDLGQFVADFENRFPSSRILNLELSPASAQSPDEKEKLQFKMDIVSLVKPGGSRPAK